MSATLIYRLPVKTHSLGDGLKFAMRDRYFSESSEWYAITSDSIPFLAGVAAAGDSETAKDAKKLIALIKKHDSIEISLEY